ncbi:HepT-like ribonuclease domain-containing protein [Echinicola salinicaeni]|uniref:HepT-like ribonuclease domain-containing protein n=1 Tax=Echinicola salinicaeni TaxID=2762757 RepID=UPI001C97BE57|nr:HepT-like ribonuclease domain-containing protein [Echinicola salinicaeni]
MQHNIKKYLLDIATSIETINDFLGDERDFKEYESNKLLRRAVERELEIIGETTNRLLKIKPDIEINEARRIVNLRNWVIHAYDNVDNIIIWGRHCIQRSSHTLSTSK